MRVNQFSTQPIVSLLNPTKMKRIGRSSNQPPNPHTFGVNQEVPSSRKVKINLNAFIGNAT